MTAMTHAAVSTAMLPPKASLSVSDSPGFILRASDAPLEVVPVTNWALRDEYFAMRYDTYVRRKGYEKTKKYPNQRMKDKYDKHALRSLVRHTKTKVCLGAVRFVLRPEGKRLPFERFGPLPYTDGPIAEISSFLFCTERIKRAGLPQWIGSGQGKGFSLVSLFLMKACFQMGALHRIEAVCGLMCPLLTLMFPKVGVRFDPVLSDDGRPKRVEYHGPRNPCWRKASDLLKGIREHDADLYNLVKPRDEEYRKFLMGDCSD